MPSSRKFPLFLLALLLPACRSQRTPEPVLSDPPEEADILKTPEASTGHYSEKYRYRVQYPSGTEAVPADGPNAGDEGETFTVHAGGAVLEGEVSGDPRRGEITTAARCRQRIEILQKYEDYDVRPVPAPPFLVTYQAVKPNWYVFSGTRGDEIFYEKGILHDDSVLTLRLHYPAAQKDVFNPLAARIAGSFEDYQVLTLKAGVLSDEAGGSGLLFLLPLQDQVQNWRTTCAIDAKDRAPFSAVQEGQTITVAGQPESLVLRKQNGDDAGEYELQLHHCVLNPPHR